MHLLKKSGKRLLSGILAVLMIFTLMPASVFAAETDEKPVGYVTVGFRDNGVRVENENPDFPEAMGEIVAPTQIPFYEGDTIADVSIRCLDMYGIEYSYSGSTKSGFYLSAIKNFQNEKYGSVASFGEFDAGSGSGWMISKDKWFINMGASEFEVGNGDTIEWQYTCQIGADIGNDWNDSSAKITNIMFDQKYGTLSPAYDKSVKEYTLTLAEGVENVKMDFELQDYWSTYSIKADGTEYKYMRDMPVKNGSTITMDTAWAAYAGEEPADTDSVKINVVSAPKQEVVDKAETTFNVAPGTLNLKLYECKGYDENGTEILGKEIELADAGVVSDKHTYTTALPEGKYSYRGFDAEGKNVGGMTVDVVIDKTTDADGKTVITPETFDLRQVNFYSTSKIDNKYLGTEDYTLTVEDANQKKAVNGTAYIDSTGKGITPVLMYAGGNAELYTITPVLSSAITGYAVNPITNYTVASGTTAVDKTFSPVAIVNSKITAPVGAKVQVFNQLKNYNTVEVEATANNDNGDGTVTYTYALPKSNSNHMYRVTKEGQITRAGYINLSSDDNAAIVINYDNNGDGVADAENKSLRPDYSSAECDMSATLAARMEDSTLVNVNGKNSMSLNVGETFKLRGYRAWQIINSDIANIMIEPDFHFNVISGDSVNVSQDATHNNWAELRAVKEGTSVIEVTYDAIKIGGNTSYTGTYGASDPTRTATVVVTVGADKTTNVDYGINDWDGEMDTQYFLEDTGVFKINPKSTETDPVKEVSVYSILNGKMSEGEVVNVSNDGTYDVPVAQGNNFIKVTTQSGAVDYQSVRGSKLTANIANVTNPGEEVEAGNTVSVTFNGLHIAVPKMSGIYNPGFGGKNYLVYTLNGITEINGKGSQYTFITPSYHAMTFETAADEKGNITLDNGYLYSAVLGSAVGAHRAITDEGVGANFNASTGKDTSFGKLPQLNLNSKSEEKGLLSDLKFTMGTSASAKAYEMNKEFKGGVNEYTIYVPDSVFSIAACAALSEDAAADSTITAAWTSTSGVEKTQTITSGKTTGQNLSSIISDDGKGTTFTVTVVSGETTQVYTIKVVRKASLSNLTASCKGVPSIISEKFDDEVLEYSTNVPATAESIDIMPTSYNSYESGYSVYVNGQPVAEKKSAAVALTGTTTVIPVEVRIEGALSQTYNITVNKVPVVNSTFNITPNDAAVFLTDSQGASIAPVSGNKYELMKGASYNYTVSKYGYTGQSGTIEATEDGTVNVDLVKSEPNTNLKTFTAQWWNFRNSENNMAIVNDPTAISADSASLKWAVKYGTGWGAAPVPPIIVDNYIFTANNTTVLKLNKETGELVAQGNLAGNVGYAMNNLVYAEGMLFVLIGNGQVQALDANTLESLWVSEKLGGQSLCPITYKNGYVYSGTWNSENRVGTYFCLSVTDEDPSQKEEAKLCTWKHNHIGGFYWAGSYANDKCVVYGSDDGTSEGDYSANSSLYSHDPVKDVILDHIDGLDGDIRSSISYDNGYVYFATKGGSLYKVKLNDDGTFDHDSIAIYDMGGMATGTPMVYKNRIYIGVAGASQFSTNGQFVHVVDAATMKQIYNVPVKGYVQTSMLLSTAYEETTGKVYIYATYNMTPGGITVIEDSAGQTEPCYRELYTPTGNYSQYCICSLISDSEGTLYYKNDSCYLMAIENNPATLTGIKVENGNASMNTFAPDTRKYEVVVDPGTKEVVITPQCAEGNTITVDGNALVDGKVTIALTDGKASIKVAAVKGTYSKEYTLNIREKTSNASLSELMVNESNSYNSEGIAMTPVFDKSVKNYIAYDADSSRNFENIWPTAEDANAKVKVYAVSGVKYVSNEETGEIDVTATNFAHNRYAIYFASGSRTAKVKVVITAEDGITTNEYFVTMTKDSGVTIAKSDALEQLNAYKSADLYRDEQKISLATAIENGTIAINTAQSFEEVDKALKDAKTVIDNIKTDEQLTVEEKEAEQKEFNNTLTGIVEEASKDLADISQSFLDDLFAIFNSIMFG